MKLTKSKTRKTTLNGKSGYFISSVNKKKTYGQGKSSMSSGNYKSQK